MYHPKMNSTLKKQPGKQLSKYEKRDDYYTQTTKTLTVQKSTKR